MWLWQWVTLGGGTQFCQGQGSIYWVCLASTTYLPGEIFLSLTSIHPPSLFLKNQNMNQNVWLIYVIQPCRACEGDGVIIMWHHDMTQRERWQTSMVIWQLTWCHMMSQYTHTDTPYLRHTSGYQPARPTTSTFFLLFIILVVLYYYSFHPLVTDVTVRSRWIDIQFIIVIIIINIILSTIFVLTLYVVIVSNVLERIYNYWLPGVYTHFIHIWVTLQPVHASLNLMKIVYRIEYFMISEIQIK